MHYNYNPPSVWLEGWTEDFDISSLKKATDPTPELYFSVHYDGFESPYNDQTIESMIIAVTVQDNPPAGPISNASQGEHSDKIVVSWNPMVGVCSEISNTSYSVGWKTTSQVTSLTVTLNPSSGRWHLTSGPDISWKNSGATISNLTAGDYTVEFEGVSGYITPPARPITIGAGDTV